MSSANALFALALALLSVWAGTLLPLAVGLTLTMGMLLRSAGRLTPPNALTFGRLVLVAGALAVAWQRPMLMVPFAVVALVLDGFDGWLARRRGQATTFGALFDQEADAALVLMLCVELVVTRGFGWWTLIAGALRYLLVLARLLARGPIAERRSSLGRSIFTSSYLCLVTGLWPALDAPSRLLVPAAVGLLLFSFLPDFVAVARAKAKAD